MNKYSDILNLITNRLDEISAFKPSEYSVLGEAQRYSLMSGGKHLRALILIQTALLGNVDISKSIDFACAIEMVHTYSLIHDDLPEMDNDDLRRGVPTCHKKYGCDIALLAGDALLTKAFNLITQNTYFDADIKLEAIRILSDACGEHGMLAGQVIDKISENTKIDYPTLKLLHARKTGDMFLACVRIGALLANLSDELTISLSEYMTKLGLVFQIKDDILDVTSTTEILGKNVNSDAKSDKSTFVSLLGIQKSEQLIEENVSAAKDLVNDLNNQFFIDLADFFKNRNK